jgi:hypothetical protein
LPGHTQPTKTNSSTLKKMRSRKKGSLQALLAKSRNTTSAPSLDLLDFLKKQ